MTEVAAAKNPKTQRPRDPEASRAASTDPLLAAIREYWNTHIHDLAVAVLPSEDQFATVWDLANNVWERYQSEQTRLDLCA